MNIADIVEARKPNQLRASDKKPKLIKPNLGHESPNVNRGKLVGEGDKKKLPKQNNPVAKHSRNMSGAGAHKSPKDYDRKKEKLSLKKELSEGPLVINGDHNLIKMIDTFVDSWKRKDHTDDEYAELLKVLGYKLKKDGTRSVITAKELEEAPGAIRKAMGAAALIAALGLSMPSAKDTPLGKELAQAASAGDPVAAYHLDKIDLYVEANDQRTLVNLKIRYLEDSDREDVHDYLAKKAGIDENYMTEEQFEEGERHGNSKIYDKCWKGYRKVPGKKAGEKGSCKKVESDQDAEEGNAYTNAVRQAKKNDPNKNRRGKAKNVKN